MTKVQDLISIGKIVLKNRMTYAPTVKFDYAGADGKVTQKHIDHYRERAAHGIGLICVEATAVTPGGRFGKIHLGLWEDDQAEGHRAITRACHEFDTPVIIQLNHTGITANPECGPAIGPSAVETRRGGLSHEMTIAEIHDMQKAFADAAVRAKQAGYDGIQLHGCHSYLINQFVSRRTNLRTDEYGGSDANRARFAAEIIRDVRERCGEDFLISVRTVGADPDLAPAIAVAEEYVKAGCDYLQVSNGIDEPDEALADWGGVMEPQGYESGSEGSSSDWDKGFTKVCALGIHFHRHFAGRVPVSCVNGLREPAQVKYLIENDLVDTVDLSRAVLADPAFPEAVLYGAPFVKCFACPRCQYGPFMPHKCPAERHRRHSDE